MNRNHVLKTKFAGHVKSPVNGYCNAMLGLQSRELDSAGRQSNEEIRDEKTYNSK